MALRFACQTSRGSGGIVHCLGVAGVTAAVQLDLDRQMMGGSQSAGGAAAGARVKSMRYVSVVSPGTELTA